MGKDSIVLLISYIRGTTLWDSSVLDAVLELGRLAAIRSAEYPAPHWTKRVGKPPNPLPLSQLLLEDLEQLQTGEADPAQIRWSILGSWAGQTLAEQSQVISS